MIEVHICDDFDGGSDTVPRSAVRGIARSSHDMYGLAVMDQDEELKNWDTIPDDEIINLRKIDLDTIYISIIQVSLALLAGDDELRSFAQGDQERADENWARKVQALNDSREVLRRLLKRIADRTNTKGDGA